MKRRWPRIATVGAVLFALTVPVATAGPALAADEPPETGWNPDTGIYQMVFPIDEPNSYSDTWGACRDGCSRRHEGTDIFAKKMTLVFASAAGTVGWMHDDQGGNCCAMALEHDDGWATWYIHLNNDTPGTDDGQGWGFAPGITSGVHVEAGQWIGYLGDSGNAESTSPHVHYELHRPDGTKINPYPHLRAAENAGATPGLIQFESIRIDDGPQHDGTGNDSIGNNNGIVECGERIELYATFANNGEGPVENMSVKLDIADEFVGILYNTSASYPDLAPGESAENPRDWDLDVATDVPGGHHFLATFTVTARFGGPWVIERSIPISCGEDITPPEPTQMVPHHGEFNVAVDSDIVLWFNEPLDPATVSDESFTVENGAVVEGSVSMGPDDMSIVFDPFTDLADDTVYHVAVDGPVADPAGNVIHPVAWTFSTGSIGPDAVTAISTRVDDGPAHDGTGNDSIGNNDGSAQCGETIEIYVTVRNETSLTLSGLSGAISESDGFARLLFNVNAPYPELSPGESAENLGDWDIRLDADTPIGHVFEASITFSLLDPIDLHLEPIDTVVDIAIPVECEPPAVEDIEPAGGATGVPVGSPIVVTFDKRIDTPTVTADSFSVENGSPVDGDISVAGNRLSATFTPDGPLEYETEYTVTLGSGITDRAGNPLIPFESTFTTEEPDLTPPEVTSVTPADAQTGVAVDTDVVVAFSEPVAPGTVDAGSFTVSNGGPVSGSISFAANGLSATFDPDASLAFDTEYTVDLSSSVTDPIGNPLVPFSSTFRTGLPLPDPGVPEVQAVRVDDGPSHDGTGNDSRGNNDGIAQCGETIEFYATALNVGDSPLTGLSAQLLESDAFVTLLYNSFAAFPDLAPGESAENPFDWDLRISSSTPGNHDFEFTLRFSSAEGGPWDLPVTVPIDCGNDEPDPDPAQPAFASVRVDDGPSHDGTGNDSRGNNDGIAQCGEIIELYVTLRNDGDVSLTGVSALLIESDGFVAILYNSSASYPNLGAGASAENPRDWDLRISSSAPSGHDFDFILRVTADGGGSWDLPVTVPIACGDEPSDPGLPVVTSIRVDDGPEHDGTGNDSKGNNDGVAQCGETIELYITLGNDGDSPLTGVRATLIESDADVNLLYNTSASYPTINPGATVENPRDWDLRIATGTDHDFSFTLRVTADGGGSWDLDVSLPIVCP